MILVYGITCVMIGYAAAQTDLYIGWLVGLMALGYFSWLVSEWYLG